jgi:hypothetical protein
MVIKHSQIQHWQMFTVLQGLYVHFFNTWSSPTKWVFLMTQVHKWGKWVSQRLNVSSQSSLNLNVRAQILSQICLIPKSSIPNSIWKTLWQNSNYPLWLKPKWLLKKFRSISSQA